MNMNKVTIAVLAAWLIAALLLATGDACKGKSMDLIDACHAATGTPALFYTCMRMLRRTSSGSRDVATYAVGAAGAAAKACGSTMDAMDDVLRRGTYPGDVQDAVTKCKASYDMAKATIHGVKDELSRCSFTGFEKGYEDAVAAIAACNENGPIGKTILHGMISSDKDMITMALWLGRIAKNW